MKEFYTHQQVVNILSKFMEVTTGEVEENAREFVDAFPICDIQGCTELSEWEGWMGNGSPGSGLIRKVNVCNAHKHLLRGYSDEL